MYVITTYFVEAKVQGMKNKITLCIENHNISTITFFLLGIFFKNIIKYLPVSKTAKINELVPMLLYMLVSFSLFLFKFFIRLE